jgi:hypothetical protein
VFRRELEKVNKEQAAMEHEKTRNAMIRKQTDDILGELAEVRTNRVKKLTAPQLEQIQADINANQANLQELFYQSTRNELFAKAHKTSMEIGHFKSANPSLENDVLTQLNNVN